VPYLDSGDARIYYEVHGQGEPVLLVHGGFCSIETMRAQIDDLATMREVHAPERPGHGRTADDGEPFAYERMADQTIAYMDAAGLVEADVIGFSDGAIIGLLLARDHPRRVRSLTAISGNLNTSGFVPEQQMEIAFGEAALSALFADYDRLSPDGSERRPDVFRRMGEMWGSQPDIAPESLPAITCPVLVMAADRDAISIDHTVAIRDAIPGARLCIVPGATHMLLGERPELVSAALHGFLSERP
jgi:pimeloyl-ACP methyl ester carboxylesterase